LWVNNDRPTRWVCRSTSETDSATGSSSGEKKPGEGPVVVDDDTGSTSSGSESRRREKQRKGGWWRWQWPKLPDLQWKPLVQGQEIGVFIIQFGMAIFVMKLLRPGTSLPGSVPKAPTTFVSVPYSEFLSRINSNQVRKVEVDGVHVMFKLKSGVRNIHDGEVLGGSSSSSNRLHESESLVKGVAPTTRIVYTTTRPSDIKTPYEKMLENAVEFGSPDKRSGGFLNTAMVCKLIELVLLFELM
jgi:cell division protease FtsH